MSEQVASRDVVETMDVMRIMEMIPHRYPFLLIDRVVDLEPDVLRDERLVEVVQRPQLRHALRRQPASEGPLTEIGRDDVSGQQVEQREYHPGHEQQGEQARAESTPQCCQHRLRSYRSCGGFSHLHARGPGVTRHGSMGDG